MINGYSSTHFGRNYDGNRSVLGIGQLREIFERWTSLHLGEALQG
jgi:hypothetical protein